MKLFALPLIALILLGITACGGNSSAVHPEDYVPELRYFDIIDSYDVDTARDPGADLALTPFRYDGLFEIFWEVNSLEDYVVTFKINDRPSLVNSIAIHSEVCGERKWCDQAGNLMCEYTREFYMTCANSNELVDILPLFPVDENQEAITPTTLYLFLEVCDYDSFYCEYDYYPVLME